MNEQIKRIADDTIPDFYSFGFWYDGKLRTVIFQLSKHLLVWNRKHKRAKSCEFEHKKQLPYDDLTDEQIKTCLLGMIQKIDDFLNEKFPNGLVEEESEIRLVSRYEGME